MNISVFGLGYVGAVCCASFAERGHQVIGVDVNQAKVDLINAGTSPIVEKGLDPLIEKNVKRKSLRATTNAKEAILNSEITFICVGTPSQSNGRIDLSYIFKVSQQIGEILQEKDTFHTIVIRSTVTPGTQDRCMQIVADFSGKKANEKFGFVANPEFLREGTALWDFDNPPYTVVGASCPRSEKVIQELYKDLDAPIFSIKPKEAEMIKYANNNFHALKVTFANEIGNICKALGIDGHKVMEIVTKDSKLNLSPYYMKPGFAYGGSCLPKDVRGLSYLAKSLDLEVPMLASLEKSNHYQIQKGIKLILDSDAKKVGILGMAFKAGTDDLRESPMVILIETLLGKGLEISIYDANVHLSSLLGKNKDYITGHIPHIYKLLKPNYEEVISESDLIVVGNKTEEFKDILQKVPGEKTIIDLVRIDDSLITAKNYVGICW